METPLSPMEFARRARKLYGGREAVVDGAVRLTYAELFARCDRWSRALQSMGVAAGDRVATISPNTHQHLEQFYAVPQLGAILVPLNYRLNAQDFAYLIAHSGAKVVCAHPDYFDAVDSIRGTLGPNVHFVALEGARTGWLDYEGVMVGSEGELRRPAITESAPIAINYTSGTTSRPKGVVISHRNAWMNSVGTLVHWHMEATDRYLWTLPMFHANGWTFTWTVTAAGATHVCLRRTDAPLIYGLCQAERITHLCAAPTVLIAIANGPDVVRRQVPRGIRVLTAGAPPAAATIERIEGELGWQVTHVYGLTETSPFIAICEPRAEHAALMSMERAEVKARQGVELITSGELRVVDEAGADVRQDGRSLGEIVARGNVVMTGYYQDPEETQKALRGGWFHSGDAAVVHADGYVEIRDRFKDVIISGGENISSIEVEGALLRHPMVLEVAVVGLPHERWGESPHAFVVLRESAELTTEELRQFARLHLAGFKVPTGFSLVPELPKTATGKIQKYLLRGDRAAISAQ